MRLIFALFLLLVMAQASAAFIDNDSYLTDTDSGLDWLDVTASANRAYGDVNSRLGVGGDFEGWRFASVFEFNTLVSNWVGAEPPIIKYDPYIHDEGKIDGLVQALGSTLDSQYITEYGITYDAFNGYAEGDFHDWTWGFLDAGTTNYELYGYTALISDDDTTASKDDYSAAHISALHLNTAYKGIGSFLVRGTVSVPEPSSIVLLSLGLIGLGFSRRKKAA